MTVREILETKLTDTQRAQLMYAFDHDIAQFVEFATGKFVGVNTQYIKHLRVEVTVGKWTTGTIRGK